MKGLRPFAALLAIAVAVSACRMDSQDEVLATSRSQLQLRAVETRAFDTTDRAAILRAVIATLQDLGFIVDRADDLIGTVTATKLSGYALRLTVTLRPVGKRILVRASGQYNLEAVTDPQPYQQFFAALSKALFLQANQVD